MKRDEQTSKTQKELKQLKEAKIENQKILNKKKQTILQEILKNFEEDVDKLSSVSKRFNEKEEYLAHLEKLE